MTDTYGVATESADGLESAADKTNLDNLTNTTWITPSSTSITSGAGTLGANASCNCTYLKRGGVVTANFEISIPNIGTASSYLDGNLPVQMDSGGNTSAEGVGIDFGTNPNAPLHIFTINTTQFRIVPSSNPSGSVGISGSYIKFTLEYRSA